MSCYAIYAAHSSHLYSICAGALVELHLIVVSSRDTPVQHAVGGASRRPPPDPHRRLVQRVVVDDLAAEIALAGSSASEDGGGIEPEVRAVRDDALAEWVAAVDLGVWGGDEEGVQAEEFLPAREEGVWFVWCRLQAGGGRGGVVEGAGGVWGALGDRVVVRYVGVGVGVGGTVRVPFHAFVCGSVLRDLDGLHD